MRKCSLCKKEGHNKRTCPSLINIRQCIVCLDCVRECDSIETTCCRNVICKQCNTRLMATGLVDCPNCRSFYNFNCEKYRDLYIRVKLERYSLSRVYQPNAENEFIQSLGDFEDFCGTVLAHGGLLHLAGTKYILIFKSELLYYLTQGLFNNASGEQMQNTYSLSILLSPLETPAITITIEKRNA